MKLPTKHAGVTGDTTRCSEDTARRPPSVKAALSVSFGQRAPHRASTRDSSPVRRTLPTSHGKSSGDELRKPSPSEHRSNSHEGSDRDRSDRGRDRDRDRYRERDRDRKQDDRRGHDNGRYRDAHRSSRDNSRRDYESRGRDGDRHGSRRSRSRSRSRSVQVRGSSTDRPASPFRDGVRERKPPVSSNLAKLMDIYGDVGNKSGDGGADRLHPKDSSSEEVIRLGGSTWR